MFEDNTNKVNYVLSYLKGTALDCFESAILDPIEPLWLSYFDLFAQELKANFGTYNPVHEAEAKLEGLHMHKSHQAMKYFIKFQQLATCIQWVILHSIIRLTMYLPNASKMTWSTKTSQLLLQDSKNSSKLLTHKTGNEKEKSPAKPTLPEPSEASPNRNTTPSPTTSLANFLPIPSRRTTTQERWKLTPQEHQHHLDNKLCLFVAPLDTLPKTV